MVKNRKNAFDYVCRMKAAAMFLSMGLTIAASAATWTNGSWSVAANWEEGVVPEAGAAVTITPVAAGQTLTVDVDSVSVSSLTFSGASVALEGGSITMSGSLTAYVAVTINNDIELTGLSPILYCSGKVTMNGALAGRSGSTVTMGTVSGGANGGANFYGSVTIPDGTIVFNKPGWKSPPFNFYAPVKVKTIKSDNYNSTTAMFLSTGNEWSSLQNGYAKGHPGCVGALPSTSTVKLLGTTYEKYPSLNLCNCDQTIDRILSDGLKNTGSTSEKGKAMTYSLRSYVSSENNAIPTIFKLNATADNQNHVRVYDKITIVYNPVGDFTQMFATNFAHTTSGDIVVSNGTFRVGGTSTFANVKRIVVADGATFDLATESANALAGVTNIVLGAGARFAIAATAETPFSASSVALEMVDDSVFELPEGANYLFRSIKVDDVHLDGGNYTGGGEVPFSGSGVVTVPDVERESVEAAWTGGGAGENVAVADNWQGAVVPPLKEGSLMPLFAAAGTQATVSEALDFKGLRFGGASADFSIVTNSPGASLTLRQGGIEVDASHKATLAIPFTVKSDQTWSIGANSSLEFKEPISMATAYAVDVVGSGATSGSDATEQMTSVLELDAENGFLGDVNISGALVNVFSATNAFGPAGNVPVTLDNAMLRVNGGVVERPVQLSGQNNKYGWFHVQAGTNIFTKMLYQADVYWRPRFTQGSVLVTEGGVSLHCDVLPSGSGEWIIRGEPLKFRNVDSTVSALELTGNQTMRFEVAGNVIKRLKLVGDCKVHCGVDNPFSGSTWLFMKNANSLLHLHGHEVSFRRADELYRGTVTSDAPGVLKFTAQELFVTNRAVQFTGAAGLEMCGTGAIVITNAMASAGSVSVTQGRLEFAGDGSWTNAVSVNVSGTGRLVVANRKTFSRQVELAVADNGVLDIPAGVVLKVAALKLDGKTFSGGTFGGAGSSAGNKTYSANFAGAGMVKVGNGFMMIVR